MADPFGSYSAVRKASGGEKQEKNLLRIRIDFTAGAVSYTHLTLPTNSRV